MSLIERAKNVTMTPATEWPVIAGEATDTRNLFIGYAMVLAAIPAVITIFKGGLWLGHIGMAGGAAFAIITYVLSLLTTFVLGLVVNALAPSFDGQKDKTQAMKLAVYASTPAWIASVLTIIPFFGSFMVFLAWLYGAYVLYLGIPNLMKAPKDKAIGYAVVCFLVVMVITWIFSAIVIGGFMSVIFGGISLAALSALHH